VRRVLASLPEGDQRRLGVTADWKNGPHPLTYRQAEYIFGLVVRALGKDEPDGLPSPELQAICDALLEVSVPEQFQHADSLLAVDWTGLESFSRPPPGKGGDCAGPEASWGHRRNNLLRSQDKLFYGYYLSAGTVEREDSGPEVPELARRATVSSCRHDPIRTFVPVLTAMPGGGIPLGDIMVGSGYANRDAGAWALPLHTAGAQLVQDLYPHDRGPQGHHDGAIIANGNLVAPGGSCWNSHRRPATPPVSRPRPTTARPPRPPAASSAASPATPPTADTACGAPPSRARSAAPSGSSPCSRTAAGPRSSSHQNTRPPAASGRRSPSRRTCSPDGAETRLPLEGPSAVLHPAHRRRARLFHRQGPRQAAGISGQT
jgi:hypothetical protein